MSENDVAPEHESRLAEGADAPAGEGRSVSPVETEASPPAVEPEKPVADVPVQTEIQAPTSVVVVQPSKVGRPDYVFLVVVAGVSLAADLGTKWWAKARHADLDHWEPYSFFDGHLKFIYAENPGGAFGLLGREPQWLRVPTFIVISIAAIWFILHLYRRLEPRQKALKLGLPLVFAGAIGNLADRVRYNFVVDFIDVSGKAVRGLNDLLHNPSDHWPTFNIADIVIVAGVLLMAVDMFQSRKPKAVAPVSDVVVVPLSQEGSLTAPPAPPPETPAESHTEG
jgi:signal peptidase II